MKSKTLALKCTLQLLATGICLACSLASPAQELKLEHALPHSARGLVTIIGAEDAGVALGVAKPGGRLIQLLHTDPATVNRMQAIIAASPGAAPVSVRHWDGIQLPYADCLVNCLICAGDLPPLAELLRVTAPYGRIITPEGTGGVMETLVEISRVAVNGSWVVAEVAYPKNVDTWSHWSYDASGSFSSHDTAVGPVNALQWVAGPAWARGHERNNPVLGMVTAGGRIYAFMDEAKGCYDATLPDRWSLVARDAFNGCLLWRLPVSEWGYAGWGGNVAKNGNPINSHKRIVATKEALYVTLGMTAPVRILDGWVYCLRASDGALVWKYRAAPGDEQILAHDRLESKWPVEGVVVRQDKVYAAAGRSSFLDGGIVLSCLDLLTGKRVVQTRITATQTRTTQFDGTAVRADVLTTDGQWLYLGTARIDPETLIASSPRAAGGSSISFNDGHTFAPAIFASGGLLDDYYFNRNYWSFGEQIRADLLAVDSEAIYGFRAFLKNWSNDTTGGGTHHSAKRRDFSPGKGTYSLFCYKREQAGAVASIGKRGVYREAASDFAWEVRGLPRVSTMVLTSDKLFVAGTPDIVDKEDPWAAMDGTLGGLLQVLSNSDGTKMAEVKLPMAPAFHGMIAAYGALTVTGRNGVIVQLD